MEKRENNKHTQTTFYPSFVRGPYLAPIVTPKLGLIPMQRAQECNAKRCCNLQGCPYLHGRRNWLQDTQTSLLVGVSRMEL